MGVKDIEEKQLEDYNDVFADIVNVIMFGGKQVVKEDELENAKDKTRFKDVEGKVTEQERDVAKWWKKCKVRIALIGLENQTKIDKNICFRLYGYDGAAYKSQYEEAIKYPVITLVLYFGYKERWNGTKSLCDSMEVPEPLSGFVNDYRMNLVELAWQTDEQVEMYKSDFKIVVDYLVQMRKHNGEYYPSKEEMKHIDAVLKMMSAMTGDERFEEAQKTTRGEKGKVKNMCEALDRIVNRGIEKGRSEERKDFVIKMLKGNEPMEKIIEYSQLSEKEVLSLAESIGLVVS